MSPERLTISMTLLQVPRIFLPDQYFEAEECGTSFKPWICDGVRAFHIGGFMN